MGLVELPAGHHGGFLIVFNALPGGFFFLKKSHHSQKRQYEEIGHPFFPGRRTLQPPIHGFNAYEGEITHGS